MTKIQFIKQDGQPIFAVVPIEIWEHVKHLVEDVKDVNLLVQTNTQYGSEIASTRTLNAESTDDDPASA